MFIAKHPEALDYASSREAYREVMKSKGHKDRDDDTDPADPRYSTEPTAVDDHDDHDDDRADEEQPTKAVAATEPQFIRPDNEDAPGAKAGRELRFAIEHWLPQMDDVAAIEDARNHFNQVADKRIAAINTAKASMLH